VNNTVNCKYSLFIFIKFQDTTFLSAIMSASVDFVSTVSSFLLSFKILHFYQHSQVLLYISKALSLHFY
jgi:hypothetical protein